MYFFFSVSGLFSLHKPGSVICTLRVSEDHVPLCTSASDDAADRAPLLNQGFKAWPVVSWDRLRRA